MGFVALAFEEYSGFLDFQRIKTNWAVVVIDCTQAC